MKYVLLRLPEESFNSLKTKKEEGDFSSWEDFVIRSILYNPNSNNQKIKKVEEIKEKFYNIFNEAEEISNYKYELELIRVLILQLLFNDVDKARRIAQMLCEDLGGVKNG